MRASGRGDRHALTMRTMLLLTFLETATVGRLITDTRPSHEPATITGPPLQTADRHRDHVSP